VDKPAGLGAGGLFAIRTRLATLVATALPPRNHATVVPFDCGRHHTTALSRADADATRSDADRIIIVPTIIVPVAVTAELNIYSLGVGRSDDRRGRQYCYGRRRDENGLRADC
jgi:hypothetical protein